LEEKIFKHHFPSFDLNQPHQNIKMSQQINNHSTKEQWGDYKYFPFPSEIK